MSAQSTLAFHGDPQLASDMLAEIGKHEEADAFLRGEYFKKNGAGYQGFRGCFIGCATHSYELARGADVSASYDSVEDVEAAFNFDPRLTKICERIFEDSSEEYANTFLRRVGEAAKSGAANGVNVRLVHWKFLRWMVVDALKAHGTPEVRRGCKKSVDVLRDLARGVNVTPRRADAAAHAAYAAYAADAAAYAADAAAHAADAAAHAAHAAYAADAAAYAADAAAHAADAAAHAAHARFEQFGDQIIALLSGDAA